MEETTYNPNHHYELNWSVALVDEEGIYDADLDDFVAETESLEDAIQIAKDAHTKALQDGSYNKRMENAKVCLGEDASFAFVQIEEHCPYGEGGEDITLEYRTTDKDGEISVIEYELFCD